MRVLWTSKRLSVVTRVETGVTIYYCVIDVTDSITQSVWGLRMLIYFRIIGIVQYVKW